MAEIALFDDIYSWQPDSGQAVFVDGRNEMLISQNVYHKQITILERKDHEVMSNSISFDKPLCESILLSPNGQFALFWYNDPITIGICDLVNSDQDDLLFDPLQYDDLLITSVFWAASDASTNADLLVVSTKRVDVYNFSYPSMTLRLLNKRVVNCVDSWYDISGMYLLVMQGNHVLVPYSVGNHDIKNLAEIELNISHDTKIEHSEISVAAIYDTTYCIYKDVGNGTISLRPINRTNTHDIVLEVESKGWLEICLVSNLLLVLTGSAETYIFDIGMKDDYLIAKVPQTKPPKSSISNDIQAYIPNYIVDSYGGYAYHISLDHNLLMLYLYRCYTEATIADFYQRRHGCTQRLLDLIAMCVDNKTRTPDMLALFCAAIKPYAEIIRQINEANPSNSKTPGIPFDVINSYIGDKSIITERSIASVIFYPYVIKEWGLKSNVNLFDCGMYLICSHQKFNMSILLELMGEMDKPQTTVDDCLVKSCIISASAKHQIPTDHRQLFARPKKTLPPLYTCKNRASAHILSVVIVYLKGLRINHLYPSHLLQVLLLDTCVLYNDFLLLKFILRSNLVKDSPLICFRLLCIYAVTRDALIGQLCLDMALRIKLFAVCVAILTLQKEYLEIMILLKQHKVGTYPLAKVLRSLANDVQHQTEHPHLWPCIISFIHCWVESHKLDPKSEVAPNLKDCEMWLPQSARVAG